MHVFFAAFACPCVCLEKQPEHKATLNQCVTSQEVLSFAALPLFPSFLKKQKRKAKPLSYKERAHVCAHIAATIRKSRKTAKAALSYLKVLINQCFATFKVANCVFQIRKSRKSCIFPALLFFRLFEFSGRGEVVFYG